MDDIVSLLIVYKKQDTDLFDKFKSILDSKNEGNKDYLEYNDKLIQVLWLNENDYLDKVTKCGDDIFVPQRVFVGEIKGVSIKETFSNKYGVVIGRVDENKVQVTINDKHSFESYERTNFAHEINKLIDSEDKKKKEKQARKRTIISMATASVLVGLTQASPIGRATMIPVSNNVASAINNFADFLSDIKELRKLQLLYGFDKLFNYYFDSVIS